MNRRDKDVLLVLSSREYSGQRDLAAVCDCSLGAINASVNNLLKEKYIDEGISITKKGWDLFRDSAPKRAVLLAAGFGVRTSPTNAEVPKALLEVRGETLIERIIRQLHEVGIFEIYVVVGFAKERFEFLIDKYGVELIINTEYAKKNNLHSLYLAKEHLENCYIIPCDLWCRVNPFSGRELYSWYMISDDKSLESSVRINLKQELAVVSHSSAGNVMIGISYLLKEQADIIRERLCNMDSDRRYEGSFWEETLYNNNDKFLVGAKEVASTAVVEVNSFEDLLELDRQKVLPIPEIALSLGVPESEITDITLLKKGLVNSSYSFSCQGSRYFVRIPKEEINELINYKHEADVYNALSSYTISDEVVYFNSDTGLKISKYIDNVRLCNPFDERDVKICMKKLRQFHNMHLTVSHEFDLFQMIDYIESLWGGEPSVYVDYEQTKKNVFSLREFINAQCKDRCLTHIDAVWENFMMFKGEDVRLIDWEYSAMQDPHLDIAMYGLYSLYNKQQMDSLISAYFPEGCSEAVRYKIYCYIAVGGLLWSNWCEHKIKSGTEFGAYSLRQYRYAKDYYQIVKTYIGREKEK